MLSNEELLAISEKMGEKCHSIWMEKRKAEKGWHNPDKCPTRRVQAVFNCKNAYAEPIKGALICNRKECDKCPNYEFKPCPQCHPCMRPYSELPDSEKEMDRAYPKIFFEILNDMGYGITRKEEQCQAKS